MCEYSRKTDAKMVFCRDYSMMIIIPRGGNYFRDDFNKPGLLHPEFLNYLIFCKAQYAQFFPHFNEFLKGCFKVMHLMSG